LTITIEGDNNGAPDGTPIATFTVTPASLAAGTNFVTTDNAANFQLSGNTRYWVVFKTTGGDNSNKYGIHASTTNTYAKGNFATSADSGSTWVNDFTKDIFFRLLFGGKASGAFSVATVINYYPRYL
jgi:hypothetical protein